MGMIIEYVLCYSSAFGLGLATGMAMMSLYYRYKESKI
jgi:hypothetical protein